MPRFLTDDKLDRVYLPSTEHIANADDRAWVVVDLSPNKVDDVRDGEIGMTSAELGISMMARRIREWNYQDESGKVWDINVENVAKLLKTDYEFLVDKIRAGDRLTDEEKKTFIATSPPSTQDEAPMA